MKKHKHETYGELLRLERETVMQCPQQRVKVSPRRLFIAICMKL